MTAFRYKALNELGQTVKGVIEGDSERQVRTQLRSQQLRPLEVSEASTSRAETTGFKRFMLRPSMKAGELALVTRQLATLVASALPLDECLQAVAEQTRRARTKAIFLQVRSRVAEGHTLAHAMGQFPQAFDEMYRSMVHAGEQAGRLAPVLEQLAEYTENRQYTAQKLQTAMIYPVVLVGVAVSVVAALMVFVVPELVGIFAHTQKQLPPLTRGLIATSDFMRDYGVYALLILVLIWLGFRRALQLPQVKLEWHKQLLSLPGLGSVLISIDTARFASTLSILMASGVPLLDALRIAGEVMNNRILRQASGVVAEQVKEGSSLNRALAREPIFPPMMVHMVASGEASGELETMLSRSALNQERELEMKLAATMGLFEPMMVVIMGGLVLTIVLAILLPIFDLNTMVR